jgi:hypothetical protein
MFPLLGEKLKKKFRIFTFDKILIHNFYKYVWLKLNAIWQCGMGEYIYLHFSQKLCVVWNIMKKNFHVGVYQGIVWWSL